MTRAIDLDVERFKQIVKGRVRKDLKRYINHGEMTGRQGRKAVTIPVPNIEIPHFRHGQKGSGGVASGDGEIGQPIGSGGNQGDGEGQAGSEPGAHTRDVEVTYEEFADMMKQELELPDLLPRGEKNIETEAPAGNTRRRIKGRPLITRETIKRKILRTAASGVAPKDQYKHSILPEDEVKRVPKTTVKPQANAAIIFMMDVSGSMTQEQKELARRVAFFSKVWVTKTFPGTEIRYVIHDARAKECNEDEFFHTHESGGTRISSGYGVVKNIINRDFSGDDWNIYAIQFSDGDNWGEDNDEAKRLLTHDILPKCNMFGYVQTKSPYGSGDFLREIRTVKGEEAEKIRSIEIIPHSENESQSVTGAIKALWGKTLIQKKLKLDGTATNPKLVSA